MLHILICVLGCRRGLSLQHEEIESSNADKAAEMSAREAESSRWHNVLKTKVASGEATEMVSSAVSSGVKSISRGFGGFGRKVAHASSSVPRGAASMAKPDSGALTRRHQPASRSSSCASLLD
jgi:hypothetical protein